MYKFTHIGAFHQVVSYVTHLAGNPAHAYTVQSPVQYRGTVKLHGSNAGVVCTMHGITAQSRTREIVPGDDNYGFASFVAEPCTQTALRQVEKHIRKEHGISHKSTLVLYGEWIGPGIQHVGVSKLKDRQFVLFSVKLVEDEREHYLDVLPHLETTFAEAGIYSIMDAPTWELSVDFTDRESMERAAELATLITNEVEAKCPWAAKFGIEGVGEGVVWVPTDDQNWGNTDLFFKSKGALHQVAKPKKDRIQISPEVLLNIAEFVTYSCTTSRLEQGIEFLKEQGLPVVLPSLGAYLKWVANDIQRECALELEASGLDWKTVNKAVTLQARFFFKDKVDSF